MPKVARALILSAAVWIVLLIVGLFASIVPPGVRTVLLFLHAGFYVPFALGAGCAMADEQGLLLAFAILTAIWMWPTTPAVLFTTFMPTAVGTLIGRLSRLWIRSERHHDQSPPTSNIVGGTQPDGHS